MCSKYRITVLALKRMVIYWASVDKLSSMQHHRAYHLDTWGRVATFPIYLWNISRLFVGYTPPTPVETRGRSPAPNFAGDAADGSRLQGQIKEVNQDVWHFRWLGRLYPYFFSNPQVTIGVGTTMIQFWMIWGVPLF